MKLLSSHEREIESPLSRSPISGFVRTTGGRGVAVKRRDGIEIYSTEGQSLGQVSTWDPCDIVVVMRGGVTFFRPLSSTEA